MGFSVTPKIHGMESHVVRQMGTIPGGLESSWSIGLNSTIKPVLGLTWLIVVLDLSWDKPQFDQAQKREHATHEIRKRRSAAIESEEKKIHIKHERREHALAEISATIELDKKEAILAKLRVDEDMEDIDELAELETKLFGRILIEE